MFVPVDVIITPRNITIDIIVDRLEHSEIDLEPVFQKRGGVWTEVQKARLIETLLLKYRVKGALDMEKYLVFSKNIPFSPVSLFDRYGNSCLKALPQNRFSIIYDNVHIKIKKG